MLLSDTFRIVDLRCIWMHTVKTSFYIYISSKSNIRIANNGDVEDRKIPKPQSFSFVFIYLNILIKKRG